MWAEDLPQSTVDFLRANPSLQFIDVTEAADSTTGNGHAYLRKSPWVSSDLLTFLSDPVFLSHHIHHFNSSFVVNPVEKTSRSFLIGF